MSTTAKNKKDFIKAYQWHIEAFDYLALSGLNDKQVQAIRRAQSLLDAVVNEVATNLYK